MARPYAQWLAEQKGTATWKTPIQQDVDAAIASALTWKQFLRALEQQGYTFRFDRKYTTLKLPGDGRTVRFKTLGKQYTPEAIQRRILYPKPLHRTGKESPANWCCTIKVDIGNSKGQYIEKVKQEATKDGSESTKIQHGI